MEIRLVTSKFQDGFVRFSKGDILILTEQGNLTLVSSKDEIRVDFRVRDFTDKIIKHSILLERD